MLYTNKIVWISVEKLDLKLNPLSPIPAHTHTHEQRLPHIHKLVLFFIHKSLPRNSLYWSNEECPKFQSHYFWPLLLLLNKLCKLWILWQMLLQFKYSVFQVTLNKKNDTYKTDIFLPLKGKYLLCFSIHKI